MRRRVGLPAFLVGGLVVALLLAFGASRFASGEPDGLERVAIDEGFAGTASDHALADAPTADYAVEGVDDEGLSTGLAGVLGVAVTFALTAAVALVARRARRRPGVPDAPAGSGPRAAPG